jgi:putative methyltransferase
MINPNPINIYFYSTENQGMAKTSELSDWHNHDASQDYKYLSIVPLLLDHYVRHTDVDLHSRLNWKKFSFNEKTQDQLVEEINSLDIDVLCFSLYTWNVEHILEISKNIKSRLNKKVLILVGGPSVDVVRPESDFILKHRDFDYAIYSHGERPFLDILNHRFMGKPLNALNTKNCVWINSNNKIVKADFEFFKYSNGSPYIDGKHLLLQIINDPDYKNTVWQLPYETTRGCPYSCSFCDWNGGLSNKVSRRHYTYKDELLLFQELGLFLIYPIDANVGMFKEDENIIDELAKLNQRNGYKFKLVTINFSKNKKDTVFRIIRKCIDAKLFTTYKVSVQDINKHILENIDRPDIAWHDHLTHIQEVRKSYPDIKVVVELIKGLPGQTRKSWKNMLVELSNHDFEILIHPFLVLPNAPASYDQAWQEKMQIKTEMLKIIATNLLEPQAAATVVSTYSYNRLDYAYFTLVHLVYIHFKSNGWLTKLSSYLDELDSSPNLDRILNIVNNTNYNPNKLEPFWQVFFSKLELNIL